MVWIILGWIICGLLTAYFIRKDFKKDGLWWDDKPYFRENKWGDRIKLMLFAVQGPIGLLVVLVHFIMFSLMR